MMGGPAQKGGERLVMSDAEISPRLRMSAPCCCCRTVGSDHRTKRVGLHALTFVVLCVVVAVLFEGIEIRRCATSGFWQSPANLHWAVSVPYLPTHSLHMRRLSADTCSDIKHGGHLLLRQRSFGRGTIICAYTVLTQHQRGLTCSAVRSFGFHACPIVVWQRANRGPAS